MGWDYILTAKTNLFCIRCHSCGFFLQHDTLMLQRFRTYGAELSCWTIKEDMNLIIKKINLNYLNGEKILPKHLTSWCFCAALPGRSAWGVCRRLSPTVIHGTALRADVHDLNVYFLISWMVKKSALSALSAGNNHSCKCVLIRWSKTLFCHFFVAFGSIFKFRSSKKNERSSKPRKFIYIFMYWKSATCIILCKRLPLGVFLF